MKQFGKILALTLGFGILAAVLSLVNTRPAGAQGAATPIVATPIKVNVVNRATSPALVKVLNTAATPVLVRDVDNAARHAFQAQVSVSLSATTPRAQATITTVPAGKRLVIEYVSALVIGPTGQRYQASIGVTQGSTTGAYYVPLSLQGTFDSDDQLVAGQPTRLYSDAGSQVVVELVRSATAGTAFGTFTVSGYLVDCGAGSGCLLP